MSIVTKAKPTSDERIINHIGRDRREAIRVAQQAQQRYPGTVIRAAVRPVRSETLANGLSVTHHGWCVIERRDWRAA